MPMTPEVLDQILNDYEKPDFYVSHIDRREVARDLKLLYQAPTLEQADQIFASCARKWRETDPAVVRSWRRN